jgi:AAR2 protein
MHRTGVEGAAQLDGCKPDELVGRCHYTQLPRLQKIAGDISLSTLATLCLHDIEYAVSHIKCCQCRDMPRSCAGLTAAELTAQNLDKSALLDDAIQRVGGNADELLAEFQLAFVTFLYGQSLEGKPAILCRCAFRLCSLLLRSALTAPQSALKPHCG